MNGNSIIGLPNPIDRDAAANKNYVDNGGAITKLPNGAFTAVSDIDFDDFSLKSIPDPIDRKDAVNKAYVDDKTIQPAALIKPIIGRRKRTSMSFRSVMVVVEVSTLTEVIV